MNINIFLIVNLNVNLITLLILTRVYKGNMQHFIFTEIDFNVLYNGRV